MWNMIEYSRVMRALMFLLLFALASVLAHAGSGTWSWTAPVLNTDNTPLKDLAGYRFVFGTSPGSLTQSVTIQDAKATSYTLDNLTAGTWYGAVIAFTTSGVDSDQSNAASKSVAADPPPPPPLLTAGPYSYEPTGTATAPTMSAIGLVDAGLSCGPVTRMVGTVKFCQIARAQADLIGWPVDKKLTNGVWARAQ